jgi:hypothetical protein
MLSGQVERNLRKLNRNVRIFCGDNPSRPAGVWYYTGNGEYEEICGIDKNFVPEHAEFNDNGTHRKGGWRRVLKILIQKRLIDRSRAEKVFNVRLEYAPKIKRGIVYNLDEHTRKLQERLAGGY